MTGGQDVLREALEKWRLKDGYVPPYLAGWNGMLDQALRELTALAREAAGVDGVASVVVPPAASSGQDLREAVARVVNPAAWKRHDWAKANSPVPHSMGIPESLAKADELLALLSAPAVQPGGDLELEWLGDRDNLILANGTQADGWWEVRRGSVKGEVRGRGPTPGKALRAAMLAPATPLPEAEEGA